jgi:hypothetical protein
MINFIQPYFNQHEAFAFKNHRIPEDNLFHGMNDDELDSAIAAHFPSGNISIKDKGETCISLAIKEMHALTKNHPAKLKIAIPSAICGSVYRAVKEFGIVTLRTASNYIIYTIMF